MRVLLVIPPMTQLNTPYPATAMLAGYLRGRGVDARQADAALELALRLFSSAGVDAIRRVVAARFRGRLRRAPDSIRFFLRHAAEYRGAVGPAIRFLQGREPELALRIAGRGFLPEGPRFQLPAEEPARLDWAFGALGDGDRARHLASLLLDDLADVIREGVDPHFELARYGEKLAVSADRFDGLRRALERRVPTLVDRYLDGITEELCREHRPDLLGLTIPFPGNVYGAFRIARRARQVLPGVRVVLGGGYVNTELRALSDPRVFDYVDYVAFDEGAAPLGALVEHLQGRRPAARLVRTRVRERGRVCWKTTAEPDVMLRDMGVPSYEGLPLDRYLSMVELLNPMHRLWSDGRWNKVQLARGCYWHRCAFCDTALDYIRRYEPLSAEEAVNRIEAVARETGRTGFHFVDEALAPGLLRRLADAIERRGLRISWWGNIRFERAFEEGLARRLADSGCIAVAGGLEAPCDRLLRRMEKGTTLAGAARAMRAFTEAGILVHAYLMYGFPSETARETVDGLEYVRQLFLNGCVQSAYWHRFALTVHSPMWRHPGRFGIRPIRAQRFGGFARNEAAYRGGGGGVEVERLGRGLRHALYNYMQGEGLEDEVAGWFEGRVPSVSLSPDFVERALEATRQ